MFNKISGGFTVLEVLIASTISIAIWGSVVSLLSSSQQSFTTGVAFLDVHADAREAMDWMIRDIRKSTRVVASRTIEGRTYTTSTIELVLELPSIDASGDIIDIETAYDYIAYHLNDSEPSRLERIIDAHSASSRISEARTVANNVNFLDFTTGDNIISVNLNTSKTTFTGRTPNETIRTQVKMRNR